MNKQKLKRTIQCRLFKSNRAVVDVEFGEDNTIEIANELGCKYKCVHDLVGRVIEVILWF